MRVKAPVHARLIDASASSSWPRAFAAAQEPSAPARRRRARARLRPTTRSSASVTSAPVDRPDRRRGPAEPNELQPARQRPQEGRRHPRPQGPRRRSPLRIPRLRRRRRRRQGRLIPRRRRAVADREGAGGVSPEGLIADLEAAEGAARAALRPRLVSGGADPQAAVEDIRVRFLGKKDKVSRILKSMGASLAPIGPGSGQLANGVRDRVEAALAGPGGRAGAALRAELEGRPSTSPPAPAPDRGPHATQVTRPGTSCGGDSSGASASTWPPARDRGRLLELRGPVHAPRTTPARDMQDTSTSSGWAGAPRARPPDGAEGRGPSRPVPHPRLGHSDPRQLTGRRCRWCARGLSTGETPT